LPQVKATDWKGVVCGSTGSRGYRRFSTHYVASGTHGHVGLLHFRIEDHSTGWYRCSRVGSGPPSSAPGLLLRPARGAGLEPHRPVLAKMQRAQGERVVSGNARSGDDRRATGKGHALEVHGDVRRCGGGVEDQGARRDGSSRRLGRVVVDAVVYLVVGEVV
jgi:hypothetical protein